MLRIHSTPLPIRLDSMTPPDSHLPAPIAFARPSIGEAEIQAVVRVMRSGWLTTGEETLAFEQEFARQVGSTHAVAVNSATAGLHLALEACGIGPGDRVLVPTCTFTATAEVVEHLGATVELVDIEPETLMIDLDRVEQRLEEEIKIRAVVPVHFAGQTCDMDRLLEMARRHGVAVIEDAAHAFPASYRGRPVGSLGDATVFSFYATKTITTGEGGMVTTADSGLAERMKVMRLHGISRDVFDRYRTPGASWQYEVIAAGYKYNLTDLASAIGRVQLARAEQLRDARERIAHYYLQELAGLPLRLPTVGEGTDKHAWHLFVVQLEDECPEGGCLVSRDELIAELARQKIGTSVHFIPLHRHPFWASRPQVRGREFPQADRVFDRCLSLPLYATMTLREAERVVDAVRRGVDSVKSLTAGRSRAA